MHGLSPGFHLALLGNEALVLFSILVVCVALGKPFDLFKPQFPC